MITQFADDPVFSKNRVSRNKRSRASESDVSSAQMRMMEKPESNPHRRTAAIALLTIN
ncbi:hypothetical protein NIES39_R01490 [Arthrospira platensis NIES-39]|nr:hypothetical protein NIES39_R01490 [Arthrospira platensis NIES-39]